MPLLLEAITLGFRRNCWFMHDSGSPDFNSIVRECLDRTYPNGWICSGRPTTWPARSPDPKPIDFYVWSEIKNIVYETPVYNEAELWDAFFIVWNKPDIFEKVRGSFRRGKKEYTDAEGGDIKQHP